MNKPQDLICPQCGKKKIVISNEPFTDYCSVGTTYRCKNCKCGFAYVQGADDDWKEEPKNE